MITSKIHGEFYCEINGKPSEHNYTYKNLILNNGLKELASGSYPISNYCLVGEGVEIAKKEDISLEQYINGIKGEFSTWEYFIKDNEFHMGYIYRYDIPIPKNTNITEVGLASVFDPITGESKLCTRALLVNKVGKLLPLSVKAGDVVTIFYKLWNVISLLDTVGEVNLRQSTKVSKIPFTLRAANVPSSIAYAVGKVGTPITQLNSSDCKVYSGNIGDVDGEPLIGLLLKCSEKITIEPYVEDSYTTIFKQKIKIRELAGGIRSLLLNTAIGSYQIQFGNDSTTLNSELTTVSEFTFKVVWSEYEGGV